MIMNKYISVRRSSGFAIRWQGTSKLLVLFLLLAFASCTDMHDPLLHTAGKVEVKPEVEQSVKIETMWQADWQEKWNVDWNETTQGEIGYTQPETYHMDYFTAGGSWLNDRDMAGSSVRVDLGHGTYDLLLYNNDLSAVHISQTADRSEVYAYTEDATSVALPDSLKQKLKVKQMPDQLFSLYATNVVVSDRLEDYEYIPEENIYLLKLNAELEPRTFIYLIQTEILNNDGKVNGCGSTTVSGLAEQVDLKTTKTKGGPIAHQFPTVFEEKKNSTDKQTRSDDAENDEEQTERTLLGGRLLTFGRLPYLPSGDSSTNTPSGDSADLQSAEQQECHQICYLALRLTKGGAACIPVDITEQMKALPKGGVINITLDLKEFNPSPGGSGSGGWGINVDGWNEENHHQPL